jgi:hypothetical protein
MKLRSRICGAGNPAEFVGQTPWSARVPLDPLFCSENQGFRQSRGADEGVGRGPGGHWAILHAAGFQAAAAKISRSPSEKALKTKQSSA